MKVIRPNFEKRNGLIPVIVQDFITKENLMLAYATEHAWRQTLETGIATFWSTSRNELWVKGATSGHTLEIVDMLIDCDGDALVYRVNPQGHPACHLNSRSCFAWDIDGRALMDVPKSGAEMLSLPILDIELHGNFDVPFG